MPTIASVLAAVVFSGFQPQLAAVAGNVYLLFGQDNVIHVARSLDEGDSFEQLAPLPVSGQMPLGMRRGPRIAGTSSTLLISAVVGARGGGADGDVVLYRSRDFGATWESPMVINDVPGSAREGLHAMAASPSGLVVLAWLDLRAKGTRIYAAVSHDHGASWAPDVLVYASPSGSVCECCHPSVSIGPNGHIAVMFRNNVNGNRDMYVTRSTDGVVFSAATRLGTNSWALDACPMDGGAIDISTDDITAVWRRETTVYLTTSNTPEQALGPGRDPVVSRSQGQQDIAWSSPAGIRLLRQDGSRVALGPGRFPTLLALRDKTMIAWEQQGQVIVQTVAR